VSGDSWAIDRNDSRCTVFVADGLGHGPDAATASSAAARVFREVAQRSPAEIIKACHASLQSPRGAAIAVAAIDLRERVVRFAGVGNITAAAVQFDRSTLMASMNGTVGHQMRTVQEFTYPWKSDTVLVMHSDGLSARWKPDQYPGLISRHPALLAGVLFRDMGRPRDDATVVVVKETVR
jgi:serine/threonine protein phosphatase PrpC